MDELKIAILPLAEAKELERNLGERGVQIRLDHNEATCRRGCVVTVEVWAKQEDLEAVKRAFNESFVKLLEGHEVDWKALNQVFDPSKDQAVCPACGGEFSTKLSECPECGLNMGV